MTRSSFVVRPRPSRPPDGAFAFRFRVGGGVRQHSPIARGLKSPPGVPFGCSGSSGLGRRVTTAKAGAASMANISIKLGKALPKSSEPKVKGACKWKSPSVQFAKVSSPPSPKVPSSPPPKRARNASPSSPKPKRVLKAHLTLINSPKHAARRIADRARYTRATELGKKVRAAEKRVMKAERKRGKLEQGILNRMWLEQRKAVNAANDLKGSQGFGGRRTKARGDVEDAEDEDVAKDVPGGAGEMMDLLNDKTKTNLWSEKVAEVAGFPFTAEELFF